MIRRAAKLTLATVGLLPLTRRMRSRATSFGRQMQYSLRQARYHGAAAGLPIPPAKLNFLVTGTEDVEWYVKSGWLAAQSVRFALERNGVDLATLRAILDFGCGSGRVIRYWRSLSADVHGTDYNPELIRWCQRNLGFAKFRVNNLRPPLDYDDATFDLVYLLSVFTHLDEPHQLAWINELHRIVRPGGYVVISTHGPCPHYLGKLTPEERTHFDAGALVVKPAEELGKNAYAAYHPVAYVRTTLARDFQVSDYLAGGAFGNPYQDLYVLTRRT